MKKLLLLTSVAALMLWGCSKDTVQSTGTTATGDAVSQYVVGIGFYGMASNPRGDAKVNGSDMALVAPGGRATVVAYPSSGYQLDYWWKYSSQPPLTSGQPIPPRTMVHVDQASFTETINAGVWYEPVFKATPVYSAVDVLFNNMSNSNEVRNDSYLEYTDENGNRQSFYLNSNPGGIGNGLRVKNGTLATLHIFIQPGPGAESNTIYTLVRIDGEWIGQYMSPDILQKEITIGPIAPSEYGGTYNIDLVAATTPLEPW